MCHTSEDTGWRIHHRRQQEAGRNAEKNGLWSEEVKKAIIINEDPSRASISSQSKEALPTVWDLK
jgi:hypothetical protein